VGEGNNFESELNKKETQIIAVYKGLIHWESEDDKKNLIALFEKKNDNLLDLSAEDFINKNRLHSLILINHKLEEINIVFRGSMYLDEWINNLIIEEYPIPDNNFKIHSGILKLYTDNNINIHMLYILKNLFDYFPKYKKIFGGHSKGNILCFLTVIELLFKFNNYNNFEIICFGNPQILNKNIADFLHKHTKIKIYNIINENDVISYLPFHDKYQIGIEILLKDNDIIVNKHNEPYHCKKNIFSHFFKSIENHDLKEYIYKLKKLISEYK
jgi:hypothetical protein